MGVYRVVVWKKWSTVIFVSIRFLKTIPSWENGKFKGVKDCLLLAVLLSQARGLHVVLANPWTPLAGHGQRFPVTHGDIVFAYL